MSLALVRSDPLERTISAVRDRLTPEQYDELRWRFERRRRVVWFGVVGRALRSRAPSERDETRALARGFPRSPRDDLDLSLRRIAEARDAAAADERRFVTRRHVRQEFQRLVGGMDEAVVATVVETVTQSFYGR